MIFGRKKRDRAVEAESAEMTEDAAELPELQEGADDVTLSDEEVPDLGADVPVRGNGPFDAGEVAGPDGRLDLGALWLAGVEGMELRLEIDQESQQVVAANAVLGGSVLQLQAFAAPRTTGIWDEIRREIADSITGAGGTADEEVTDLGRELRTRMPQAGPGGRTVFAPARFIGVDGPRWFLRGVISGQAAIDDQAAAPLLEIFRQTVVVRGSDAMAPRELLSLQLPQVPQEPADASAGEPARPSSEDFNPFERGPEITEVR